MAAKYNFSATRYNRLKNYQEEFQVVNCDSFEEARRIVEKAIHERELHEVEELKKLPSAGLASALTPGHGVTTARPHPQQMAPSGAVSTPSSSVPTGNPQS